MVEGVEGGQQRIALGKRVWHKVLSVNGVIAHLPAAGDFLHNDKVSVQFCVNVKVVKASWCSPVKLEVVCSSPRLQVEGGSDVWKEERKRHESERERIC